jgi:hypothetical protein
LSHDLRHLPVFFPALSRLRPLAPCEEPSG